MKIWKSEKCFSGLQGVQSLFNRAKDRTGLGLRVPSSSSIVMQRKTLSQLNQCTAKLICARLTILHFILWYRRMKLTLTILYHYSLF